MHPLRRCGNVAAILALDENLNRSFGIFEAAAQVSWLVGLHNNYTGLGLLRGKVRPFCVII
jgi:hypothetical protein